MKRSEMVEIMSDKYLKDKLLCSAILEMVEQAGMLPPRNPNVTFEQQLEHNGLHFWEAE